MIDKEYQYINQAFEETKKVIHSACGTSSINLSDIETFLIKNAGQLCASHANDVIEDILHIRELIEEMPLPNEVEYIVAVAIRENGTDSNAFMTARLSNYKNKTERNDFIQNYYRKIFAVKIIHCKDSVNVELKDIKKQILKQSITHD